MTKRDFLERVIATNSDEEILAFAKKELESLARKNAKAEEKRKEKSTERYELVDAVYKHLVSSASAMSCADVIAFIGVYYDLEYSTPKAAALMKLCMEKHPDVVKVRTTVDGKKKICYALKTSED